MAVPTRVEISYKTIIFTVCFLISLWLLVQMREVIFWIFVSFILMSALKPMVEYLEHFRIGRGFSVIIVYILLILFFLFIGSTVLPPFVSESFHFMESLPEYVRTVLPFFTFDSQFLTQQITPVGENVVKVTLGLFSNIISLFTIIIISFYLIIERKGFEQHLSHFMGEDGASQLFGVVMRIEQRLGSWVRGQLLLMLIIGLSTFIGLSLLGLPFVIPLSILAGLLEIVPIIGPIISAIPAILIAFTISPVMALGVGAFYFFIQQAEAHFVVPMVMKKTIGMPPLVTIVALMVGSQLAGVTGALLSVPIVLVGETVFVEYFRKQSVSAEAHKPDSVSSPRRNLGEDG